MATNYKVLIITRVINNFNAGSCAVSSVVESFETAFDAQVAIDQVNSNNWGSNIGSALRDTAQGTSMVAVPLFVVGRV